MKDWYVAGMFDETFWAQIGKQRFSGKTAAEMLRQIVAEAGKQRALLRRSAKPSTRLQRLHKPATRNTGLASFCPIRGC